MLALACWGYYQRFVGESALTRALTPIWTVPLERTNTLDTISFEFSWPSDPQWRRIEETWESPKFFLARFKAPPDPRGRYVGLPLEPLSCRILRDGVELQPERHDTLTTYPEFFPGTAYDTSFPGLLFHAEHGTPLRIEVSLPKGRSIEGLLALSPYLRGGQAKGIMISNGVMGSFAFWMLAIGVALIGIRFLLAYLDRRNALRRSAREGDVKAA